MNFQYQRAYTILNYQLHDHYLLFEYQNRKTQQLEYKHIKDIRHYCKGRSNLSGCGIAIYTEDDRIELQPIHRDVDSAKQLKVQIFAKMNQSH